MTKGRKERKKGEEGREVSVFKEVWETLINQNYVGFLPVGFLRTFNMLVCIERI